MFHVHSVDVTMAVLLYFYLLYGGCCSALMSGILKRFKFVCLHIWQYGMLNANATLITYWFEGQSGAATLHGKIIFQLSQNGKK